MDEALKNILIRYCESNNIEYLGLFGSMARGEQTEKSDMDLLIRFRKRVGLFQMIRTKRELETITGRKIDLLTEKSLSPHIRENVLNDTETLYNAA